MKFTVGALRYQLNAAQSSKMVRRFFMVIFLPQIRGALEHPEKQVGEQYKD
jgi:hypothetical protein